MCLHASAAAAMVLQVDTFTARRHSQNILAAAALATVETSRHGVAVQTCVAGDCIEAGALAVLQPSSSCIRQCMTVQGGS
jgi:hypothetical protein